MARELEKRALSPRLKSLGLSRRFLRQSPKPDLARDMTVVRSLGKNILDQSLQQSRAGGPPNVGAVSRGLSSAHRALRLSGNTRLHGGTGQIQGMVNRGMSRTPRRGSGDPPMINSKRLTPPKIMRPKILKPDINKPSAPNVSGLMHYGGGLGRGSGLHVTRAA